MLVHKLRLVAALLILVFSVPMANAFFMAEAGRWINRDRMEEEGGHNLYAMVFSNPVNDYDSFGLQGKGGKPRSPKWNPDEWQALRENCCAYAYDLPGRTIQPGELGGMDKYPDFKKGGYTCAELEKRIKADFPNNPNVGPPKDGKCPVGYHNTKPWVQPDGKEYHMQRQDEDGNWSEMPYGKKPRHCSPKNPDKPGDIPCDEICVPDAARY